MHERASDGAALWRSSLVVRLPETRQLGCEALSAAGCVHFRFAARAYQLGYRSQRETPSDRALSRAQDLRHKLKGSMALMDAIPEKPKWMRWKTYERKVSRIEAAERICNAPMWLLIKKLDRRRPRL